MIKYINLKMRSVPDSRTYTILNVYITSIRFYIILLSWPFYNKENIK